MTKNAQIGRYARRKLAVSFLITILSTGCSSERSTNEALPDSTKIAAKEPNNLPYRLIDSAEFWRSYVGFETWSKKEAKILENRDPDKVYISSKLDSSLRKKGFIYKGALMLSKFKSKEHLKLKDEKGNYVFVQMGYVDTCACYRVTLKKKDTTAKIDLIGDLPDVKVATVDIISGGYPEIIFLRNFYFMNGDHYYIHIYEVK